MTRDVVWQDRWNSRYARNTAFPIWLRTLCCRSCPRYPRCSFMWSPEEELAAKGITRDMRVVHFFRQKKMLPVSKAEDNQIPKKHSTRVEEARKFPISSLCHSQFLQSVSRLGYAMEDRYGACSFWRQSARTPALAGTSASCNCRQRRCCPAHGNESFDHPDRVRRCFVVQPENCVQRSRLRRWSCPIWLIQKLMFCGPPQC
jgi:hypothetical protein